MYSIDTVIIPIAFAMFAALLLWVVIGVRGWWWLKLAAITVTLFFSISVWHSVNSYMGWPTSQVLPAKFEFHWAKVKEPSKLTGDPGSITLWVTPVKDVEHDVGSADIFEYNNELNEPRAYRTPYTKQSHKDVQNAMNGIKKGKRVMGNGKTGLGDAEGEGGMKGNRVGKGNKKGGQGYAGEANGGLFILYDLPPPKYPEKSP